jgi:hypothetical protein
VTGVLARAAELMNRIDAEATPGPWTAEFRDEPWQESVTWAVLGPSGTDRWQRVPVLEIATMDAGHHSQAEADATAAARLRQLAGPLAAVFAAAAERPEAATPEIMALAIAALLEPLEGTTT